MADSSPDLLDQLGALVEKLGKVSRCVRTLYGPQNGTAAGWMGIGGGLDLATFLADVRRTRDIVFAGAASDDCGWDMILDLAKAEVEGLPMYVSGLCAATGKPQTSALRKLKELVQADLVLRYPDPSDRRRVCLQLTDKARQSLDLIYQQLVRKGRTDGDAAPILM